MFGDAPAKEHFSISFRATCTKNANHLFKTWVDQWTMSHNLGRRHAWI